jgi:hypothetical protein
MTRRGRGTRLWVGPRRRTRAVRRGVQGRGYPLAGRAVGAQRTLDDFGTAVDNLCINPARGWRRDGIDFFVAPPPRDTDIASSSLRELDAVAPATNAMVFLGRDTSRAGRGFPKELSTCHSPASGFASEKQGKRRESSRSQHNRKKGRSYSLTSASTLLPCWNSDAWPFSTSPGSRTERS